VWAGVSIPSEAPTASSREGVDGVDSTWDNFVPINLFGMNMKEAAHTLGRRGIDFFGSEDRSGSGIRVAPASVKMAEWHLFCEVRRKHAMSLFGVR
jgi:hypothetical protein